MYAIRSITGVPIAAKSTAAAGWQLFYPKHSVADTVLYQQVGQIGEGLVAISKYIDTITQEGADPDQVEKWGYLDSTFKMVIAPQSYNFV